MKAQKSSTSSKRAPKLKPVIAVRVAFGADNQASYELDPKVFPTVSDVRANIKSKFKNATKAEVTFPGGEAEILTFSKKKPAKKKPAPEPTLNPGTPGESTSAYENCQPAPTA